MTSNDTILDVQELRKSYGGIDVLHGIDLKVATGERVALTGPSGSGKSTLLNCLSGIEPINSGKILIGNDSVDASNSSRLDRLRREQIGYVFQSFHLLPTLTALENIELPGQLINMPREQSKERAASLLRAVGLEHRANHRPEALSGGERQRVALARAVMHRPRLILADEPTGSLDSSNGAKILDLLESLSIEHKIALLLVTHDLESTRICERTLVMRDGRIVEA